MSRAMIVVQVRTVGPSTYLVQWRDENGDHEETFETAHDAARHKARIDQQKGNQS